MNHFCPWEAPDWNAKRSKPLGPKGIARLNSRRLMKEYGSVLVIDASGPEFLKDMEAGKRWCCKTCTSKWTMHSDAHSTCFAFIDENDCRQFCEFTNDEHKRKYFSHILSAERLLNLPFTYNVGDIVSRQFYGDGDEKPYFYEIVAVKPRSVVARAIRWRYWTVNDRGNKATCVPEKGAFIGPEMMVRSNRELNLIGGTATLWDGEPKTWCSQWATLGRSEIDTIKREMAEREAGDKRMAATESAG